MSTAQEILGEALQAFYLGDKQACIDVHTQGQATESLPVSLFFRDAEHYPIDEVALTLCRGRVLDVGAGVGLHALHLQRQGLEVSALDASGAACAIMRLRGVNSIIRGDIFKQSLPHNFDTWLMLGRSVGLAGSLVGLQRLLQLAYINLNENGLVVLNSYLGPERQPQIRQMSFEYGGQCSEPLPWLDVDYSTLAELADQQGFECDVLRTEDDGNYLAVLNKLT
ncbi:class I SAM-dependent methyltransferase [Aliagarivorans taiwanensis]|uniref:class I SAM-dependent methyltransferase n=1 Tax=Aliagarivorans taiwanensis TaxID=561966 RepID=UPI0003FD2129|nr:class I SAM-dependent methyltransferase [Aliagarivorans taiwanensis]